MDGYIICATPRTGSTLLCGLLAATGRAGAPDSFFMRDPDPAWVRDWGLPERAGLSAADYGAAFLAAARRAGTGTAGLFGLRLMRESLDDLQALIATVHPGLASDRERIAAAFGRMLFIHLARDDKLAQAVSMVRAEQTGLWHVAPDGSEVERLAPPAPPRYDFARIAARLAELEAQDRAWQSWFETEEIVPLQIGYERLSADPAGELGRLFEALDLAPPAPETVRPGVGRLADALSEDWMRRFRAEGGVATR